ncbi:MAG: caspase family protein, partial [Leptospira sp.]|nr:caspase family protein [Leptospira sp.]
MRNLFISILLIMHSTIANAENMSEGRVALVIGIKDYAFGRLFNPVNDASDMSDRLSKLNFQVINRNNLSKKEFKQSIKEFGEILKKEKNKIGLFYFSGHGVQHNGSNYLIPKDAIIEKSEDIEEQGVNLNLVLAEMEWANNRFNIVILDACRNSPFPKSVNIPNKGLTVINRSPGEMFIAYSTSPDTVASDGDQRNGLYTQELLKYISVPGKRIEEIFKAVRVNVKKISNGKQLPWDFSSLSNDFYFIPPKFKESSEKQSIRTDSVNGEPHKEDMLFYDGTYWDLSEVYALSYARAFTFCFDKSMRL